VCTDEPAGVNFYFLYAYLKYGYIQQSGGSTEPVGRRRPGCQTDGCCIEAAIEATDQATAAFRVAFDEKKRETVVFPT